MLLYVLQERREKERQDAKMQKEQERAEKQKEKEQRKKEKDDERLRKLELLQEDKKKKQEFVLLHSCQPSRFWRNFPDFLTLSRHPAREFQNSAFCFVVETLITQPVEFSNCERK